MSQLGSSLQNFLLVLSALFSIVNPIGSALIFSQVTADRSHEERLDIAGKVGLYSAIVMLVALWGGAYVLNFFGVTLAALRIAGGLVVSTSAWSMLSKAEENEERKQEQASHATGASDVAFFPLTMPFTTGPGTISVAIALGSNLPTGPNEGYSFFLGASLAALAVAVMIWIAYRSADRLVAWLGHARARVLARLAAFLLLCVGTQITLNGVVDALRLVVKP
ncbi:MULTISPECIES: MarC family protein [Lichenihabitans]|uniref:MarC family protein n=1 Tax=Lichenihabitans TaxID=2723776 RepID=UPI001035784E|nr:MULTISPECIES: MarC family protein [Lichenihabitans]UDL93841.1 NAAT family transporter [Lichenihabitans sp. PAMC28606]